MTLENHSVLGSFSETYSASEKRLCLQIATQLEKRENACMPKRDDMHVYVRTAASLYELAKRLVSLNQLRVHGPERNVTDWLRIMTGITFYFEFFSEEDLEAIAIGSTLTFIERGAE